MSWTQAAQVRADAVLKSLESSTPCVLIIHNNRSEAVKVYWSNFDGVLQHNVQSPAGAPCCMAPCLCLLQETLSYLLSCHQAPRTQSTPTTHALLAADLLDVAVLIAVLPQTHPWRVVDAATGQVLEQMTAGAGEQLLTVSEVLRSRSLRLVNVRALCHSDMVAMLAGVVPKAAASNAPACGWL